MAGVMCPKGGIYQYTVCSKALSAGLQSGVYPKPWRPWRVSSSVESLKREATDIVLHTAASLQRWGAKMEEFEGSIQINGLWNLEEQKLHIICLALLTGLFGLQSLCTKSLRGAMLEWKWIIPHNCLYC